MPSIDLNADVGEGYGQDAELMPLLSSANIACGWHAGDADTMRRTVRLALAYGVAIGAHPGYPDREHFGRREMYLPAATLYAAMLEQIGTLAEIVQAEGARLAHVKPHGALYNQAARDRTLAETLAAAVRECDPTLRLVGLAGGELIAAGRRAGLAVTAEAFADRRYQADGNLVPRSQPGALIENEAEALAQALALAQHGQAIAQDGSPLQLHADSLCLHGDSPHALAFARRIRQALERAGVAIQAPTRPI
jgi:UPF0271 protein